MRSLGQAIREPSCSACVFGQKGKSHGEHCGLALPPGPENAVVLADQLVFEDAGLSRVFCRVPNWPGVEAAPNSSAQRSLGVMNPSSVMSWQRYETSANQASPGD